MYRRDDGNAPARSADLMAKGDGNVAVRQRMPTDGSPPVHANRTGRRRWMLRLQAHRNLRLRWIRGGHVWRTALSTR